jgi:hypothetical protein
MANYKGKRTTNTQPKRDGSMSHTITEAHKAEAKKLSELLEAVTRLKAEAEAAEKVAQEKAFAWFKAQDALMQQTVNLAVDIFKGDAKREG